MVVFRPRRTYCRSRFARRRAPLHPACGRHGSARSHRQLVTDAEKAGRDRLTAGRDAFDQARQSFGSRWLGDDRDHLGGLIAFEGVDCGKQGDAADSIRDIAPSRADAVRNTRAPAMYERREFLQSGPGSAYRANRSAADDIGKAKADAAHDGRSTIRAHDNEPMATHILLKREFVFNGHVTC